MKEFIGERGGRFLQRHPLAEGRRSGLYLAEPVAVLKIFKPGLEPGMKELALFGKLPRQEGLLLPFDHGEGWLALPYMPGGSLKGKQVPVPGLLRRLLGILEGLHAAGWVHRDLSPANILLDAAGRHWLIDFGCALRVDAVPAVSRDGLGTPAHAAPEQLLGGPASFQGDLYALGSICYECLAGVPPFETGFPERTAARKVGGTPRPIRELAPEVPAPLAALVADLLQADPRKRPRSAREALDRLGG